MLGVNYKRIESNSVGNKTDYTMYSMDFEEFLWANGYGKETVNKAIKHLTELSKNKETPKHIARGLDNGLYELKKYGIKDKDRYETALKILLQTVEFADQSDIDALSKMKTGKKDVWAKPKQHEGSEAFKADMQKTMRSFPRLYDFEKQPLESFAEDIYGKLQENPGKEQELLDHYANAYQKHIASLGPWVDTPTLVKKAFIDKMIEKNLSERRESSDDTAKGHVEKAQKFESETGITPEDYEAYEDVRQSGVTNMFDIGRVSHESGLPADVIKNIMKHYSEARAVYGDDEE